MNRNVRYIIALVVSSRFRRCAKWRDSNTAAKSFNSIRLHTNKTTRIQSYEALYIKNNEIVVPLFYDVISKYDIIA